MGRHSRQTKIGRYTLVGNLGTGGMSRVYRAIADGSTEEVALKLTPVENDLDVEVTDYHREVMVGRRLKHPLCVTATDHGCQDGFIFLVMPIVDGEPLSQVTRLRDPSRKPSSKKSSAWKCKWAADLIDHNWTQVARIGRDMSEALAACHSAGVIHRDIKPGNILMNREGVTWLMDFGLAWMRRGPIGHELITHAGTNRYLPPEIFRDERDERSDIYSLGITMQELATGLKPWGDVSHDEIGDNRPELRVKPIREICPQLPQELADCIDKASSDDPDDRHQTADELLEHFRIVHEKLSSESPVCVEESCLRTMTWHEPPPAEMLTEDVWFS